MTVAFSAYQSVPNGTEANAGNDESKTLLKGPTRAPMLLEVSMVTTLYEPMTPEWLKKAWEGIVEFKDMIQETIDDGKAFYERWKLEKVFGVIKGVGQIAYGIYKFIPDKEHPLIQGLKDLEREVKKLNEKLISNFNEMKALISEQSFFTNIMRPTSVLSRLLSDCLNHPGEESTEEFRKAYKVYKPLTLLYNLQYYLQQKTTNPVRMSLQKKRDMAEYKRWEDIIGRIVTQFIYLEAFATGLLDLKNEATIKRMATAADDINKNMESTLAEYDKEPWNELRRFVGGYMARTSKLSKQKRAEDLREYLNGFMTQYVFYIIVFDSNTKKYDWHCLDQETRLYKQLDTSFGNCIIYRSRTAKTASDKEHETLKTQLSNFGHIESQTDRMKGVLDESFVKTGKVPSDTFLFVAPEIGTVTVFTNKGEHEKPLCKSIKVTTPSGTTERTILAALP